MKNQQQPKSDFLFTSHGSICLLRPLTDGAKTWLDDNVGSETQWWAGALVIEPRYFNALAQGISAEGFSIANGPGGLN